MTPKWCIVRFGSCTEARSESKCRSVRGEDMRKLVILLLLCSLSAAAKNKEWQTAVIVASQSEASGQATFPVFAGGTITRPIFWTYYLIHTPNLEIEAATRKPINVTLKKEIRICIDGKDVRVIDDDGKERKLRITKKTSI